MTSNILWYYVYSPKYEIFHHILSSSIDPDTGFQVRPAFVPQDAFSNNYNPDLPHFFSGNTVKIQYTIDLLKANLGSHIIISDADIIVNNSCKLRTYLESYMCNDITFMKDNMKDDTLNIGFGLIKSTIHTIHFFEDVLDEIIKTNGLDQAVINARLPSFSGSIGMFSIPELIQSNMYCPTKDHLLIQLLCSNHATYEENLLEKLVSAAGLINISAIISLIPTDVHETLHWCFQTYHPEHYLAM